MNCCVTYRSYSQGREGYPYNLTDIVHTIGNEIKDEKDKEELDLDYLASLLDTEKFDIGHLKYKEITPSNYLHVLF